MAYSQDLTKGGLLVGSSTDMYAGLGEPPRAGEVLKGVNTRR